ncbi:MAG TPA: PIN domain-containing protein [Devosia sp.]|jgi:predicted nucleic acid-binding protein
MILPDTSVWVDHFRRTELRLQPQLEQQSVAVHPFVIAELALGDLKKRGLTLFMLGKLPPTTVATNRELLHFIEQNDLATTGIGFVDAHLLLSAKLTPETSLWTHDKRLLRQAERLGIGRFAA